METATDVMKLAAAIIALSAVMIPMLRKREIRAKAIVKIEYQTTTIPNFVPTYCTIVSFISCIAMALFWFDLKNVGLVIMGFDVFYFMFAFHRRTYPLMREEVFAMMNLGAITVLMLVLRFAKPS